MNLSSCNCDYREGLEVVFEDAELDFVLSIAVKYAFIADFRRNFSTIGWT